MRKGKWKIILLIAFLLAVKNILLVIQAQERGFYLEGFVIEILALGKPDRRPIELMEVLINIFPLLLCESLFGISIYKHFCTGAIYYFSRLESRNKWFFSEIRILFGEVLLFCALYLGLSYVGAMFLAGGASVESVILLLETFILYLLFLFLWSLILNLVSIYIGSQTAYIVVISIQAASLFLIYLVVDVPVLFQLNPIANLVISWHSLPNGQENYETGLVEWFPLWFSVIYESAFIIILILLGSRHIRNMDIALENKEEQG